MSRGRPPKPPSVAYEAVPAPFIALADRRAWPLLQAALRHSRAGEDGLALGARSIYLQGVADCAEALSRKASPVARCNDPWPGC